jgi:hypothetical protein
MWDVATGAPISQPLDREGINLHVATAQSDERPFIISGDDEGTIRIWDPFRLRAESPGVTQAQKYQNSAGLPRSWKSP